MTAHTLTRAMVFEDFSYYLSERSRTFMTNKAWYQYQRSREIYGAEYAYREYIEYHTASRWEEEFPEPVYELIGSSESNNV